MIRRKKYSWFMALLAVGLLAGCTSDGDTASPNNAPSEISIIATNDAPMPVTRASVVNDNAGLQALDLRIDAYYNGTTTPYLSNKKLHYSASTWGFVDGSGTAEHYYWPLPPSNGAAYPALDFVGYAPYSTPSYITSITYTAGNPSFTVADIPVNTSGQSTLQEFMYGVLTNQTYATQAAAGGRLPLEFQHPFAKITIQLKPSHRAIYRLNTISFKNIKNNGTFTHGNSPQWATSGVDANLVVTLDQAISADADFTSAQVTAMNLPFIVIPQTYTAANQIEVKLTWVSGEAEQTYTFNNPVSEWQSGKSYTYTLDLLGEIKFSVNIDEWSEEADRNLRFSY